MNQDYNLKIFLIRLSATAVAVILVMYLAKVWFVDQLRFGLGGSLSEQTDTTLTETQELIDSSKVISWQEAAKYTGQYVTVEGRIIATYNSGKACFLNFHPNYKRYLTAVIFASAFSYFPPNPQDYYYGKKVRIKGYIKEYQGSPEIILEDPSQIEILE